MILDSFQDIKLMNMTLMRMFKTDIQEDIKNIIMSLENTWFKKERDLKKIGGFSKMINFETSNLENRKITLDKPDI